MLLGKTARDLHKRIRPPEIALHGGAEYHEEMDSAHAELEPHRIAARSAFRWQAEIGPGGLIELATQQALTQFAEQSPSFKHL
jgi:hypothetical protein